MEVEVRHYQWSPDKLRFLSCLQRHKLGTNLTPVTPETFAKWKKTRMDKKEAEAEALKKAKETQNTAGKSSGMSGRDLVRSFTWPAHLHIHLVC